MSYLDKLMGDIHRLPDDFRVKGSLGSGPAARVMGAVSKVVIPGDSKITILLALNDLLGDLAVDCNWSNDNCLALHDEIWRGEV